jgi:hypothetical protein
MACMQQAWPLPDSSAEDDSDAYLVQCWQGTCPAAPQLANQCTLEQLQAVAGPTGLVVCHALGSLKPGDSTNLSWRSGQCTDLTLTYSQQVCV